MSRPLGEISIEEKLVLLNLRGAILAHELRIVGLFLASSSKLFRDIGMNINIVSPPTALNEDLTFSSYNAKNQPNCLDILPYHRCNLNSLEANCLIKIV